MGLGLTDEATFDDVQVAIEGALAELGASWDDVAVVATTGARGSHRAVSTIERERGIAVETHDPGALARVRIQNASAVVASTSGTPSVAEAAALLSARAPDLLVPKQTVGPVTFAIAVAT